MANPGQDLDLLLTVMAATPELDGLLLLDVPGEFLPTAADRLAQLLREPGDSGDGSAGSPRSWFMLGAYVTDDELWTRLAVGEDSAGNQYLRPEPGLLVQQAEDTDPLVVVIPDLARLSMAARRTLIMLLDSPVAHLERHGQHLSWRPRLKWLAGCASASVGEVSRHILDRFPVRFAAGDWGGELGGPAEDTARPVKALTNPETAGTAVLPAFPAEARARAGEYFPGPAPVRREIALSRIARGLTRLDGAASVATAHIDDAARLMGLAAPVPAEPEPKEAPSPPLPAPAGPQDPRPVTADLPLGYRPVPGAAAQLPVPAPAPAAVTGDAGEPLAPGDLPVAKLSGTPYPEDEAGAAEAPMLTSPDRPAVMMRTAARGPVVGIRQATEPRDLAWVPTLTEAAKFQVVRRHAVKGPEAGEPQPAGLILFPTDLRVYRRSGQADALLLLLLDHTCLRGADATVLLASYLNWAATRRAAVTVVEVGAAGTAPALALRAWPSSASRVQDPAIQAALGRRGGQATPLAHGLEIAKDALRHARRTPVSEVWLVVVTDGLGNVPLAASLAGAAGMPWGERGLADALTAASSIAAFESVNAVLIAPPRLPHPELPGRLAAAMGAGLIRAKPAPAVPAPVAVDRIAHAS